MRTPLQRFKSQIRSSFFKNLVTLLSGTTLAQLIPLLISPVLTRLYTPEEFGILGLFVALTGILSNVASGRYELAILLPRQEESAKRLFVLSIAFSLMVNLILLLLILVFSDVIATLVKSREYITWIYWVPLATFLFTAFQSFNFLNNRNKEYLNLSKSKVGKSLGTGSLQLGAGFMDTGASGLIGGQIVGQAIGIAYLWNKSQKYLQSIKASLNIKSLKTEAFAYKKFPMYTAWTNLINKVSIQLPILFFTRLFTAKVVGFYSFAYRILATPVNLAGVSIGQVFYQRATEEKKNSERFRQLVIKLYNRLLLVAFIPIGINLVFGDYLFGFIFGPEWKVAGQYSQALTIWILFVFINAPLTHLFNLYGKQEQWFALNAVMLLGRLAALLIFYWIFNDVLILVIVFGVVSTIGQIFQIGYILNFLKINYLRLFLKTFFVLLGIALPLYLLRYLVL